MPDPISYLKASVAALLASAMIVLACRPILRNSARSIATVISVLAVGVGAVTGYDVLEFSWTWPPANALNRFLMFVLPAAVILELLSAVFGRARLQPRRDQQLGRSLALPSGDGDPDLFDTGILTNSAAKKSGFRYATGFRLALYASVGRILLHDSVYLGDAVSGKPDAWTFAETLAAFGGSFVGLIALWSLLRRLSERSAAGSIIVSLALVIQCTGLATMMAGYIKGGAAAIPLTAALTGTALASPLLLNGSGSSDTRYLQGAIGIGVIGLFSLLCIAHYFGQLTGVRAIVLFLTPLICWISELPGLRLRPTWQKSVVRLLAVSMVLAVVVLFAKQDFDRKMAPLLAGASSPESGRSLTSGSTRKPSGGP